jgi:hypothetical protein
MDTSLRQMPAENQGSGLQSTDPMTSGRPKKYGPYMGHNGWLQVWDRSRIRARPGMADMQACRLLVKEIQCFPATLLDTQARDHSCA